MPSRNTVKEYAPDNYYHVYNRGVEKRIIFLDDQDYKVFLGLLKKYLSGQNHNKNNRHPYKNLSAEVSLNAFCLMPNHFHLLLHQTTEQGIQQLMRRVLTGYVMYFNDRYKREGRLFQGTYKAAHISNDDYLQHISRYIHLNPKDYKNWTYSSLPYYRGDKTAKWLNTEPIIELFNSRQEYLEFIADYEPGKKELEALKWQLANNLDD